MRSHPMLLVLAVAGAVGCAGEGPASSQEGEEYSGWATVGQENLEIECGAVTFSFEVEVNLLSSVDVEVEELTEPLSAVAGGGHSLQGVQRGDRRTIPMLSGSPLRLTFTLPAPGTDFAGTAVVTLSNPANPADRITYTLEFSRPCDPAPEPEPDEYVGVCTSEPHDFTTCDTEAFCDEGDCSGYDEMSLASAAAPAALSCFAGYGEQPPPPPIPGLPPPPPMPQELGGVFCVQTDAGGVVTSLALPDTGRCSAVLTNGNGQSLVLIGTQSTLVMTEVVLSNPDKFGALALAWFGTIWDIVKIADDQALVVNTTVGGIDLTGWDQTMGFWSTLANASVPDARSAVQVPPAALSAVAPGRGFYVLAGAPTSKLYYGATLESAAMQPVADVGGGAAFVRCNGKYVAVANQDDDTCYVWKLAADGTLESATPTVIQTGDGPWKPDVADLPDGSTLVLTPNFSGDSVTGAILKDGAEPLVTTVPLTPGAKPVNAKFRPTTFRIDVVESGMGRVTKVDAVTVKAGQ